MVEIVPITRAQKRAAKILGEGGAISLEEREVVVARMCSVGGDSCFFEPQITNLERAKSARRPEYSPCHPNSCIKNEIILYGSKDED
jgi:hypothetical protein